MLLNTKSLRMDEIIAKWRDFIYMSEEVKILLENLFKEDNDPLEFCKKLGFCANQNILDYYIIHKSRKCIKHLIETGHNILNMDFPKSSEFLRILMENGYQLTSYKCYYFDIREMDMVDTVLELSESNSENVRVLIKLGIKEGEGHSYDFLLRIFNHSPNILFGDEFHRKIKTRSEEFIQLLKFQVNPCFLTPELIEKYKEDLDLKNYVEYYVLNEDYPPFLGFIKLLIHIEIDVSIENFANFFVKNIGYTFQYKHKIIFDILQKYPEDYSLEVRQKYYKHYSDMDPNSPIRYSMNMDDIKRILQL